MKEVARAEKAAAKTSTKKSRRSKIKEALAKKAADDTFKMDVDDPRFAAIYQSSQFAIDPSNPQCVVARATPRARCQRSAGMPHAVRGMRGPALPPPPPPAGTSVTKTTGMKALLDERQRRRAEREAAHEQQQERSQPVPQPASTTAAAAAATEERGRDLADLVASVRDDVERVVPQRGRRGGVSDQRVRPRAGTQRGRGGTGLSRSNGARCSRSRMYSASAASCSGLCTEGRGMHTSTFMRSDLDVLKEVRRRGATSSSQGQTGSR